MRDLIIMHVHSAAVVPEAGSPKTLREGKPRYPRSGRQPPWRPANPIRRRPSEAKRTVEFMRNISRQEIEVSQFMRAARDAARQ